ncbi:MAG: PEP-CTERM sorting domain-containing protein [Rubrivivax sp.]|nr:PEP-CTERM sorting domain-containing protein [Rubrivivax sp.]
MKPFALLSAATFTLAGATAQAGYVISEVSRPGNAATALWDINNAGVMVGYSNATMDNTTAAFAQGFVYDGSTFTALTGPAGAVSSAAMGISDGGTVVGSYFIDFTVDALGNATVGAAKGFIYSGGSYTTFEVAGAESTFLRGISPDGRYLSGYYSTPTVTGVGFVVDRSTGTFRDVSVPNSQFTIAQGVTDAGLLVGGDIIGPPPVVRPGFFYDFATDTRTDVNLAGARRTSLRALTDDGVLAGWYVDAGNVQHGFVGSIASFETIDVAGADATYLEGMNNARTLVGGFFRGDTAGAYIARLQVPEPGSLALLVAALLSLALWRQSSGSMPKATSTRDTML